MADLHSIPMTTARVELLEKVLGWLDICSSAFTPQKNELQQMIKEARGGTLSERFQKFCMDAQPGVMFVNEFGRRSEIIEQNADFKWDGNAEHGPFWNVRVHWADADEPTVERMIWYTIGTPEAVMA